MNDNDLKVHSVCDLFPLATKGSDYDRLYTNIKEHGQQVPIVVDGDTLLDGRRRRRICNELGIEPKVQQFSTLGTDLTPGQWIMSINLHRRSLTDKQRMAIAAKFERLEDQRRKEESAAAKANEAKNGISVRNHTKNGKRGRPSSGGRLREKIARAGGGSQYTANQLLKLSKADPELATAVEENRMTLLEAMKKAGLHKTKRQKAKPGAARPETAEPAAQQTSERTPDGELTDSAIEARLKGLRRIIQTTCKDGTSDDLQQLCFHAALCLDESLSQRVSSEANPDDMPRETFESLIGLVRTQKSVIVSDFPVGNRASHWLAALWSVHDQERPELFANLSKLLTAWGDELSKAKTTAPKKAT